MSNTPNMAERLELRDAAGATVGVYLSDQAVKDLMAERDRLRKQLAESEAERDHYLNALHALARKNLSFPNEELADLAKFNVPFERVLADVEKLMGAETERQNHG